MSKMSYILFFLLHKPLKQFYYETLFFEKIILKAFLGNISIKLIEL